MLVTMILIAALLSGGAILTKLQTDSTRGTQLTRASITGLYCAESGIVAARATVMTNYALWNAALGQSSEPAWLASVAHDIDGDNVADFTITLRDNDDDADFARDNDLAIYIVSTCVKNAEAPVQVTELVQFNGGGNCYQAQLGGCGGNNNAN